MDGKSTEMESQQFQEPLKSQLPPKLQAKGPGTQLVPETFPAVPLHEADDIHTLKNEIIHLKQHNQNLTDQLTAMTQQNECLQKNAKDQTTKHNATLSVCLEKGEGPLALEVISSREESTDEDLIATLMVFVKQNPRISLEAFKRAGINYINKLSTSETLDLKLLLRLPMQKLRQLRTFLTNHGIPVLASDRKLYKELKGRRNLSDIKVGEMVMQKAANAKESKIAFVRVNNIHDWIKEVVHIHEQNDNLWEHQCFHNEAWVKIGGDKGGPSTKLVAQIVNVNKPNSATTTEIISMYNAFDNYSNMKAMFDVYTEQFVHLQNESTLQIGGCEKPVRVFLFGDYEWLTKILGHLGPVSTFPCLWCYIHRDDLYRPANERTIRPHSPMITSEDGNWCENALWYAEERTPGQMATDLANCKEDKRNKGDSKKNSKFHHSIFEVPILPMGSDMVHVVPPVLHIMLGLTVRFYKQIEDIARTADGSKNVEENATFVEWNMKTEEVKEIEEKTELSKADLRYQVSLLEGFRKCMNGNRGNGLSDKCALATCALARNKVEGVVAGDISWIRCDSCDEEVEEDRKWFHVDCVGLKGEDYVNMEFHCPQCRKQLETPADIMEWQTDRVESCKESLEKMEKEKGVAEKELAEVYEEVKGIIGPREKLLNSILDGELHVKKQAYHSQCFVGNHCKKILRNSVRVLACLEGLPDHQRYVDLLGRLDHVFSFTSARFLCDNEVEDVRQSCWALGIFFCSIFPEQNIPPKLHILISHVPECALLFRTLGLLSEHGIESLHAQVNADARQYAPVRDNIERLRLVFNLHSQRALVGTEGLNTGRRKCQCGGWFSA
ncbi:uncharacterized protein [Antedon mediterranea]|uniref:uncharacterized protein n=1 Tax=Antedon mediterranea TaxID=105859 RepID=UPI003AF99D9D